MDQPFSRRAVGLAGAGIAALAAAAPAAAKKKRKATVPPLIQASAPLVVLEDATPDGSSRSGVRYRILIGGGAHAVQVNPDQQILAATASALLAEPVGTREHILQITGTIVPRPQDTAGRGLAEPFTGRFAGTFNVLSGVQDPETGEITLEVDIIDVLTKVFPGPASDGGDTRMIGAEVHVADAAITRVILCC